MEVLQRMAFQKILEKNFGKKLSFLKNYLQAKDISSEFLEND